MNESTVPLLCGYCRRAPGSIFSIFTYFQSSGSTLEFETFLSQAESWSLIYGREKPKLVVASKTVLLLFCGNIKIKQVFKERVLASY